MTQSRNTEGKTIALNSKYDYKKELAFHIICVYILLIMWKHMKTTYTARHSDAET